MLRSPSVIKFPKLGNPSLGYISLAEKDVLDFKVKRIYWTYYTPDDVERGMHAHIKMQQILVALAGIIQVSTELTDGTKNTFILDSPDKGLHLPNLCWREIKYTHNAVQMCIADMEYNEKDYIRDYEYFKSFRK